MRRLGFKRLLVAFTVLTGFLVLFLVNTGVREVRRTTDFESSSFADLDPSPDDWPCWRGSARANVVPASNPPIQWSISQNVKWKTSVPGRGHSSPCLSNDRIFLTTSDTPQQTISLICFDRETGQSIWQSKLHQGRFTEIHKKNTHASATPASDGKLVYTSNSVNGSIWVTAVDFTGRIVWQCEAGPYSSEWGYGSSPAIYQSMVIVAGDNRGNTVDQLMGTSWLTALDRRTGKIVWRVKRPDGDSFGSPVVAYVAGRDQLLLAGKEAVFSYHPQTGDILWKCRWGMKRTANTVTFDRDHVFASGRQPESEVVCIRADGTGDVTETHVVWREKKSACDVPSPCIYQGAIYSLADDGVLTCLNAVNGKPIWKRRLGGNVSSSPLIAGNHLFCCNEDGLTFVTKLTEGGEVVAENNLNDGIMASPVVSRDQLFIRTLTGLYCLEAQRQLLIVKEPGELDRR